MSNYGLKYIKGDTTMAKEMVAMLLAGGQGSRLYALTQKLAKPAVPFGGNIVSSTFHFLTVLTQELTL